MRVYATEETTGRRILVRIECDRCDASVRPHPEIASSGWTKRGTLPPSTELDLCQTCSD